VVSQRWRKVADVPPVGALALRGYAFYVLLIVVLHHHSARYQVFALARPNPPSTRMFLRLLQPRA
jgi:hypothetical protein